MPAITSGKVLVTGANGFIAGWIAKHLLEHGFSVRGTVRSAAKAEGLREALANYSDRLDFAVVEDITESGAFDQAVKGVDTIVHTASPVHLDGHDPEELIRPAVRGTTGILHSASLPDSTVKRVVIVSSLAAIVDTDRPTPATFTEVDWNERDVAEVREKGVEAGQHVKYRASKTLAERAAWDVFFAAGKENGAVGQWDLVTLCPPWVFGPALGARSPKELSFSVGKWYEIVVKEEGDLPTWSKASWTDVRDFAAATRLALNKPEAGGERFIISTGPYVWGQWVNIARRLLGKSKPEDEDSAEDFLNIVSFDNTKSRELLGVRYNDDMEATAAFMLEDFRSKGWC